jgi:uncharacterized protein YutE (UPF0331/DUF86 family)
MVDLDRIPQRLELLAGYLCELRRLRDLPVAEYLRHEVYAGRYLVQVAAQTCIDLANHIIVSEGWRPRVTSVTASPSSLSAASSTTRWLAAPWPRRLVGRLRGLAGLRNRLVYVYDEIDDTRVHELLAAGLPDLDAFATASATLVS